jgi:hypothetical protein
MESSVCKNYITNEMLVAKTWVDFLALPKIAGYENNINRVPNSFSERVVDKKGDRYTTLDDCLSPKK